MSEHYFSPDPAAPSRPASVRLSLPDGSVDLATDRGVFSPDRIDPGTRLLLLEGGTAPDHGDLADVGCGYGPIAITLARRSPGARVWAIDVNERALDCCRRNAEALGLDNVVVATPDEVPASLSPAEVWSNPPVRIGKAPMRAMIADWADRLGPQGRMVLVVHRHLGADSLHRWLEPQGRVTRLRSRSGYRVLEFVPQPSASVDG